MGLSPAFVEASVAETLEELAQELRERNWSPLFLVRLVGCSRAIAEHF